MMLQCCIYPLRFRVRYCMLYRNILLWCCGIDISMSWYRDYDIEILWIQCRDIHDMISTFPYDSSCDIACNIVCKIVFFHWIWLKFLSAKNVELAKYAQLVFKHIAYTQRFSFTILVFKEPHFHLIPVQLRYYCPYQSHHFLPSLQIQIVQVDCLSLRHSLAWHNCTNSYLRKVPAVLVWKPTQHSLHFERKVLV